jgi:predicted nucleic acid-binding protein
VIGWLLDTDVTAEIISTRGSERVKEWAANQDEATLYLSILSLRSMIRVLPTCPTVTRVAPST